MFGLVFKVNWPEAFMFTDAGRDSSGNVLSAISNLSNFIFVTLLLIMSRLRFEKRFPGGAYVNVTHELPESQGYVKANLSAYLRWTKKNNCPPWLFFRFPHYAAGFDIVCVYRTCPLYH